MKDTNGGPALVFPCTYPIKVIGKAGADFVARVESIVRRHVPHIASIRDRASHGGKYLAVTLTFEAAGEAQLSALYRDLMAYTDVILVL